ncbi:MAG: DUF4394 domain-containing protein [Moraxellaceae bacterium]|nr:DUF4394 domain-containing protein [Moraxellaceae bacterium]MDZ4386007.1 DUF4394 domain-containing protein [Moraxellaceae bacterium]
MKNITRLTILASSIALVACGNDEVRDPNPFTPPANLTPANVLTGINSIGFLNADAPANSLENLGTLTGVVMGDQLVSVDRRPQTGYLYALGYNASAASLRVYVVHPDSLVATPLGQPIVAVPPAAAIGGGSVSTRFEMDFNPAVDRLRVVSTLGENYRINPNNGALVERDGDTNIGGALTSVAATAYTNSAPNLGITTQYTVTEGAQGSVYIQNPPNNGTLTSAKVLNPALASILGFDIAPGVNASANNSPVMGLAYALVKTNSASNESIVRINLDTGAVTSNTAINNGAGLVGLAIQKPDAFPIIALSADGTQLIRFAANAPGVTTTSPTIMGVTAGESLVGIDIRPATGELFALGVNSTLNTASLYRVDPQTAAATVIGVASGISNVDVTFPDPATVGYGFDFNPTVDRIRVTASNGLNLRLNPVNGGFAFKDGNINGAVTGASAAAYTNSVETSVLAMGAAKKVTTLYVIDNATSKLTIQSPPNDGTQISAMDIRVNGNVLSFTAANGFDIPSDVRVTANNAAVASGFGFAALTVSGTTSLYRINLSNGNAENLGTIGTGTGLRGLAVGQTHAK